jgi:hypothetical protein
MKKVHSAFYALLISFFWCTSAAYGQTSITDDASAPSIDGKVESSEWRDATVFTDFYMMIPKTEEKIYDSTIVYIKQTKDALYFAFKYWPKGKVLVQSLTRDRSTEEENEFFILLDLENKGQNGYIFVFNFGANQRDMLVYNQRNASPEWDWIWNSKTTVHSKAADGKPGFIETEIRIPVDKLQNKNTKQIGIDLQMFGYKPDGTYYYYSLIPNSELLSLKNTYKFDLKRPFEERLNLNFSVAPFVTGKKFNGQKYGLGIGGDATASLNKHKLKATIFTDQSTLEADPFSYSFYNRPIFLQEKRTFFSKDLDIYSTPINLFYTRSIDSIDYGANYTFRSDLLKAGVVYVNEPKYDKNDSTEKSKQYFVARPRFNLPDFNVGGIFIYTDDRITNTQEKVLSVDSRIYLPYRLRFIPQYVRTIDNKGDPGNAYSAYLYYEFDNSGGFYGDVSYSRYDKNFRSSTTFNDYGNDYHDMFANVGYNFVRNTEMFSNINVNASYYSARTLSDAFKYQERGSTNISYRVNGWLSLYHYFELNYPNDFDAGGNVIKRKNFLQEHNVKFLIGANSIFFDYFFGTYFGTYLKNPSVTVNLNLINNLSTSVTWIYREFFDIKQTIYRIKLDYRIMDKLFLRSYFQKDTYGKRALWNTLLQYEFFAGSNAYLVLNLEGPKLQNTRRVFKLGYEFNF